ncbi:MAG TPA: alginate export family protein [Panacibacter sp.]|nr:alginate export family protein [Panacibacter sp.]
MRKKQPKLTLIALAFLSVITATAQDSTKAKLTLSDSLRIAFAKLDSLKAATAPTKKENTLTISVDMRTRTEIRHGYRVLPTKDTGIAAFTNQRTRLNFDYKNKKVDFFASLQDTRQWGQQDPREGQTVATPTEATTYPLYLFEIYAEPRFGDKFSVRVGRQRLIYDNQRLFAENDWRLPGNSHDAVRFIYNNKINLTTEFFAAYNQFGENSFGSNYKPTGFINYKTLLVHYLNWKVTDKLTFLTINSGDGFQSSLPNDAKTTWMRFTSGGRLEYSTYNWYFTMSGYKQYGRDSSGKKLNAYYLQPEIKYTNKSFTARLGVEYLSGQDSSEHLSEDKSFVPLYGVAHRFMGNMDLFATFPTDVNNAGLINPYLFLWYRKNKIWLRFESHLFYSQSRFLNKGVEQKKYLGFENDWRINYKVTPAFEIESGFCWAAITDAMVAIKKSGDTKAFPYWGYLTLRFTPTIGKFSF